MGNIISKIFGKNKTSGIPDYAISLINKMPVSAYQNLGQTVEKALMMSDLVYTIVNKKAQIGSKAPFGVYKIKSNKAYKAYKELLQDKRCTVKRLLEVKEYAITAINHDLTDLYDNPNTEMSSNEYTEALLTMLNTTGNSFEHVRYSPNTRKIIELGWLPPNYVEIITDGLFPLGVAGYQMQIGRLLKFEPNEVIHSKYFNPLWSVTGSHLYGMSPIQTGWSLINSDIEGLSASAEQRRNRGARKIIAIENDKVRNYAEGKEIMDKLSNAFNDRYNEDYKDKLAPLWGDAKMLDVGLTAKDMQILETSQMTFDRLCNLFKVPVGWFNSNKESKYSNLEQYNKQAILNGVIPDLIKLKDARNNWARRNKVIKDSEVIDFDMTVFTELDIDRATMWEWLKDAPLTANEKRVYLGEQPINIEGMNNILVSGNSIPIEMAGKVNIKSESNEQGKNKEGN